MPDAPPARHLSIEIPATSHHHFLGQDLQLVRDKRVLTHQPNSPELFRVPFGLSTALAKQTLDGAGLAIRERRRRRNARRCFYIDHMRREAAIISAPPRHQEQRPELTDARHHPPDVLAVIDFTTIEI